LKLLVDENISPITSKFLRELGHDVKEVRKQYKGVEDREVARTAIEEERCIVTQDDDFGEIYYFSSQQKLKVAVLKPSEQRIESINELVEEKLEKIEDEEAGLFILEEDKIRSVK
jgi:predicted nuclease of predicted toxin-antitoxin system